MASYPKWLYHPSKSAVVVADEAAHKALGAGWVESPADAKAEPVAKVPYVPVGTEEGAPEVEPTSEPVAEQPKRKRTAK